MIIRDVIHKDINIEDDLIESLISSFEFQRLRKIKQLGLNYFIFPSTEHSRYTHSIGTYYLCCNVIEKLEIKKEFNRFELQAIKIACLLHDLGHGPLSHTSEEFFKFNHEDFTVKIIQNKNGEIYKILSMYDEKLIKEIVLFIQKKHPNKVLNKILSGTIDVDRMDYLIRDSHFAGVNYGQYDYNRIMQLFDVFDGELVFCYKGSKTLEDMIMSRYYMFNQVYLNKKTLGYEALAEAILNRVKLLYDNNFNFKTDISKLIPFLNNNISVDDYLKMNDGIFLGFFDDWYHEEDILLKNLCFAFTRQTLKFDNEENNNVIEIEVDEYNKKIYNESVLLNKNNKIVLLEEESQLINFAKNELEIISSAFKCYVKKEYNE